MRGFHAVLFLLSPVVSVCQTIIEDDFTYPEGDSIASHGWTAHASAGTNPIRIVTPGLAYPGHPGTEVGNAVRLAGAGEDVHRSFSGHINSDVYLSMLVQVNDASTGASEYFAHFNIGTFVGRVYAQKSGGKIAFGVAKSSEGGLFSGFDYDPGTVYLVVIRYTHTTGDGNDTTRLYVFLSGIPPTEPEIPTLGPITSAASEPSEINAVVLRQGASSIPEILVDGVRVATSWSEAGLPVTLTSFEVNEIHGGVELKWRTASELNCYGFGIERRQVSGQHDEVAAQWLEVGFMTGQGSSSTPTEYRFMDTNVPGGRCSYRIKQIDNDGSFHYSVAVEVDVSQRTPPEHPVVHNYPNPFNATTIVRYAVPRSGRAVMSVFDAHGRRVRTLFDQFVHAGAHDNVFDGTDLAGGVYFLRLESAGSVAARKILLIK